MNRWPCVVLLTLLALLPGAARPVDSAGQSAPSQVQQVDWEELLPENERGQFASGAPAPVHDYLSGESGPAAPQQVAVGVNAQLDGRTVKIPGFIVPLDLDEDHKVVEFFLVPYFGACIHVPPPPANQIVYVTLEKGIALDSMYEAYWITGKLSVKNKTTRLGAAAYTLAGRQIEVYKY